MIAGRAARMRSLQRQRKRRGYAKRIDRAPSPLLAAALPWVSVVAMSLLTAATVIASAPLLPPLGFLALLAWRLVRPGMLPVWAGFPLGAADDLYSGQPFGSAVLLWSGAMLVLELVDQRLRWRGFVEDWAIAAALLVGYPVATAALASLAGGGPAGLSAILPQVGFSLAAYPLMTRFVALLDRVRLLPLRTRR